MRLRVGTSGFSYKEWRGTFYPEDLTAAKMLPYYAGRFDAVEINNTFYRTPTPAVLEGWRSAVGARFSFVLKAPMRLVHLKRSPEIDAAAKSFFETTSVLGKRLGPVLLHVPPHLQKDIGRLRAFFALVPRGIRVAVEFGHASWFDAETYGCLEQHGAALVVVDDADKRAPLVATAEFVYVRLRAVTYDRRALASWGSRLRSLTAKEAWVFFKHEDAGTGPVLATRFHELWRTG